VPPPEHLLPGAVANAVILSAVVGDPAKIGERFQAYLALVADVQSGANRWPEEAAGRHGAVRPPPRPPQARRP
jgi:hypothetical protein